MSKPNGGHSKRTYNEKAFVKLLRDNGYYPVGGNMGSHQKFSNGKRFMVVPIARLESKQQGLVRALIKDFGLKER